MGGLERALVPWFRTPARGLGPRVFDTRGIACCAAKFVYKFTPDHFGARSGGPLIRPMAHGNQRSTSDACLRCHSQFFDVKAVVCQASVLGHYGGAMKDGPQSVAEACHRLSKCRGQLKGFS